MTDNNFHADNIWQREIRDKELVPFYNRIASNYILLDHHPDRPIDSCVMAMQLELGVDTLLVFQKTNGQYVIGVEEKIVRWPKDGEQHSAYALETHSCTLPGRYKDGWMCYSAADTLLYAFEQADGSLLVDLIAMQRLRKWFWESVSRDRGLQEDGSYKISVQRHRCYDFPMFQMPTKNRTEMRVVPIREVWNAIPGCKCYRIGDGEILEQVSKQERLVIAEWDRAREGG